MGIRQELAALAAEAAANAPEEAPQGEKKRKGGTAKFKMGSMVLVPHTDQVGAGAGLACSWARQGWTTPPVAAGWQCRPLVIDAPPLNYCLRVSPSGCPGRRTGD